MLSLFYEWGAKSVLLRDTQEVEVRDERRTPESSWYTAHNAVSVSISEEF